MISRSLLQDSFILFTHVITCRITAQFLVEGAGANNALTPRSPNALFGVGGDDEYFAEDELCQLGDPYGSDAPSDGEYSEGELAGEVAEMCFSDG